MCGGRFESLQKSDVEVLVCEKCGAKAKKDEVPQLRHLDKLGADANYNSVRFNFNW